MNYLELGAILKKEAVTYRKESFLPIIKGFLGKKIDRYLIGEILIPYYNQVLENNTDSMVERLLPYHRINSFTEIISMDREMGYTPITQSKAEKILVRFVNFLCSPIEVIKTPKELVA